MTDSVVVEGYARLRDGKKWKTRWLVARKPSPVADCLLLLVFKDKSDRAQGHRERASVTLEEICGLETGQCYEGVAFTLSILCLNQAALLGFDSKEALQAWDARLQYNLGEVHRFSVGILPGTKLESGPATLHLCNGLLALARDVPPTVISHWNLPDLRRYGPLPNGFVFEGGTRCGYWAGVFLLASADSERISFLFDCIVRGVSPTRGPFGLRPVLPDPSCSRTGSEERLNQEAQELEKRLSTLSHGSSTASCCPSVGGGDDRSISGSSDTSDASQSDGSVGGRLATWAEPAADPPEGVGHVGAKAPPPSVERLSVGQAGRSWPGAKPPRQLQEIGRQSSSDSGIATGSHSSYSGSFSSYAGSLDAAPGEDFGSVFSLPPHLVQDLSPCTCPTGLGHDCRAPTSLRYIYDSPRGLLQDGGQGAGDDRAATPTEEAPASLGPPADLGKAGNPGDATSESLADSDRQPTSERSQEETKKGKVAPSSGRSCHTASPASKTIVTICPACGGFRGTPCIPSSESAPPALPAGRKVDASPRQPKYGSSAARASENTPPPLNGRAKLASLLADLAGHGADGRSEGGPTSRESKGPRLSDIAFAPTEPAAASQRERRAAVYENCFKCQGKRCRPPPPVGRAGAHRGRNVSSLETNPTGQEPEEDEACGGGGAGSDREEAKGQAVTSGVFVFPPEAPPPERARGEAVTYVNIPVSPTSKKQLNYLELELQDPGPGTRGPAAHLLPPRKSSSKYAQIDIAATETAHKVGLQHALGRQEGLHTLELRRKGAPR
ncbi:protein Dok-7-like [Brachionichthys hirsutus]|uniref:protein Dok-7-like n=1 Tax=Brachionichthys hirsutus TaxID=412623 RepID=UPI003604749C